MSALRLQWLDYLATMRERKTWLAAAMLAYAVVSIPVLLQRPAAHVAGAMRDWFGQDEPFALFMYLWIDLAMNKVVAFLPVVLASGVVLQERDTRVLAIVAAKPISMPRYFLLRALSACAVMATLHVAAQLAGALWFGARVEGFRAGPFLVAMMPHLFAAVFATALTAAIAMWVRRRTAAALVSLGVLSTLVGLALVGYYQPAWRELAWLNPITLGSAALGHLDSLELQRIAPPMLALAALSGIALGIGALGARRIEP